MVHRHRGIKRHIVYRPFFYPLYRRPVRIIQQQPPAEPAPDYSDELEQIQDKLDSRTDLYIAGGAALLVVLLIVGFMAMRRA